MKYRVQFVVTYTHYVEADSPEQAEEMAQTLQLSDAEEVNEDAPYIEPADEA